MGPNGSGEGLALTDPRNWHWNQRRFDLDPSESSGFETRLAISAADLAAGAETVTQLIEAGATTEGQTETGQKRIRG